MPSKDSRHEKWNCPIGAFLGDVERTFGKESNFFDHITRSRIEILKAIRSLLDERIDGLDAEKSETDRGKMKNIKVS